MTFSFVYVAGRRLLWKTTQAIWADDEASKKLADQVGGFKRSALRCKNFLENDDQSWYILIRGES